MISAHVFHGANPWNNPRPRIPWGSWQLQHSAFSFHPLLFTRYCTVVSLQPAPWNDSAYVFHGANAWNNPRPRIPRGQPVECLPRTYSMGLSAISHYSTIRRLNWPSRLPLTHHPLRVTRHSSPLLPHTPYSLPLLLITRHYLPFPTQPFDNSTARLTLPFPHHGSMLNPSRSAA